MIPSYSFTLKIIIHQDIKSHSCKTLILRVKPSDTVKQVKQQISNKVLFPKSDFELLNQRNHGDEMRRLNEPSSTLAEHGIFKNHRLYITEDIITLNIKQSQQKSYSLLASQKCTVSQLKHKIAAHCKLNHTLSYGDSFQVYLNKAFHQVPLQDHLSLEHYKIRDSQTLYTDIEIKLRINDWRKQLYIVTVGISSTIKQLKQRISQHYKLYNLELQLSKRSSPLSPANNKDILQTDSRTIWEYAIMNYDILYVDAYVRLYIKCPDDMRPRLLSIPYSSTIKDVKKQIIQRGYYARYGMSFTLRVSVIGGALDDNRTLEQYKMFHNYRTLYIGRDIKLTILKSSDITNKNADQYSLCISSSRTISQFKQKVAKHYEIYNVGFGLISKDTGKYLDKLSYTLERYGIKHCENLHIKMGISWRGSILGSQQCFYDLLSQQDIDDEKIHSNKLFKDMRDQWDKTHTHHHKIASIYKININFKRNMDIYNAVIKTSKSKLNQNGLQNERMLFHGTSLKNLKSIIVNGFNRDHNIRGLYGKGTYFSNLASLASQYCQSFRPGIDNLKFKAILVCKVFVGDSTIGRRNMNESELYKLDKVTQYDSLVDNLSTPKIFVINRDYHAVPCFIIVFTSKKDIVGIRKKPNLKATVPTKFTNNHRRQKLPPKLGIGTLPPLHSKSILPSKTLSKRSKLKTRSIRRISVTKDTDIVSSIRNQISFNGNASISKTKAKKSVSQTSIPSSCKKGYHYAQTNNHSQKASMLQLFSNGKRQKTKSKK